MLNGPDERGFKKKSEILCSDIPVQENNIQQAVGVGRRTNTRCAPEEHDLL